MSLFSYKIGKTNFVIKTGSVKEEETDMLFNWTVPSLSSGDDTFIEIHREGGSTIYKECQGALVKYGVSDKEGVKEIAVGSAVITGAGMLPTRKIIHTVLPNFRNKDEKEHKLTLLLSSINYAFALINEYSSSIKPMRKVTVLPITERIYGEISQKELLQVLKVLINNVKTYDFREVRILCSDEETYTLYKSLFEKNFISFTDRLYRKLFG